MIETIASPVPQADLSATEITATLRRVRTFPDSDWAILEISNATGNHRATGELEEPSELAAGINYRFFGHWEVHPKFGTQFKFDSISPASIQTMAGTIAFLSRSNFGIERPVASRAWKAYGADTLTVLRDHPDRVVADRILDLATAQRISRILMEEADGAATKIALFELFSGFGFPKSTVKDCVLKWGDRSPAVVRRDPFSLLVAGITGAGFKRSDDLYQSLGGNPARLKRQTLAAWHWMNTNGSGNTWEVEGGLMQAVLKAAGSVVEAKFARAIELGVRAKWLCKRVGEGATTTVYYAERGNAFQEDRLAKHVKRVLRHAPLWPIIAPGEGDISEHQREKVLSFTHWAVAILAGTPGTGKTFAAAVILRKLLETMPSQHITVCAPTGKAAVRITEAMRRYKLPLQATTIHRLLKVTGIHNGKHEFERNENKRLDARIVVVDEASMIDTDLAAALFAAVPSGGSVLLVGDPYQLPPVGHGAPLRDLIGAGVPCGLLTEIKRNSGQIVLACRDIKDGKRFATSRRVTEATGDNLVHFPAENAESQQQAIVAILGALKNQGIDPIWDCQTLVATNEKSQVSRKPLNEILQRILNPDDETVPEIDRNPKFRHGDKVICLKNTQMTTYEHLGGDFLDPKTVTSYRSNNGSAYLANGDIGRIEAVDKASAIVRFFAPERIVRVLQKKKKSAEAAAAEGGDTVEAIDFDLAYAITTHKSQGSEWPAVIVVLDELAGPIGCREWLYTAISRASRMCFLVGKIETGLKQAAKVSLAKRKTFLRELVSHTPTKEE